MNVNNCTNIKAGEWGRLNLPGGIDLTLKVLVLDLQESMSAEGISTQEMQNRLNIPPESLQPQGGSGRLFCSNCKETDVTFSQFHLQRLIMFQMVLGRFHSSRIEFSFCNYSVSFYMYMRNKTKGIIICIL